MPCYVIIQYTPPSLTFVELRAMLDEEAPSLLPVLSSLSSVSNSEHSSGVM